MSSKTASLEKKLLTLDLEERIGYTFRNKSLLQRALTHLSYANEQKTEANSTLALLGDSLLNALMTWKLYQKKPNATPGDLTERRKSYVSQGTLSRLAREFGFERHLLLGKGNAQISPRMLAETFESLLGAIFLDGGFEALTPFLDQIFSEEPC